MVNYSFHLGWIQVTFYSSEIVIGECYFSVGVGSGYHLQSPVRLL